jgi:hypothetical protein
MTDLLILAALLVVWLLINGLVLHSIRRRR